MSTSGGMPCGGHPCLDSRPRRGPSGAAMDTACGGLCPLPSPAGRAWTVGRRRPPCSRPAQGLRPCPRRMRPSGQHLAAIPDGPRTLPRCPVPRTPAGFQARSARPADTDGPDAWTVDAALWTPVARLVAGAADTCGCGRVMRTPRQGPPRTAGSSTLHRRPKVRPGTEPQGAAPASTAGGLTARSVVWGRPESQRRPVRERWLARVHRQVTVR